MAGNTGLFVARDSSNAGTTPKGARLALGGLLAHDGVTPLGVRKGVLLDGGGPVVSGTGSMSYDVRAFVAVVMATTSNGPVVAANDALVTLPTGAAPGSNSRIDVIYARQKLVTGDGGSEATNEFEIGVVQGAVAVSPAAPAIPTGALSLASVRVTAGATSTAGLTFTRTHDWTVANGGVIPDSAGDPTWFDGTGWSRLGSRWPGRPEWGATTVTYPTGGPTAFLDVNFATSFATAPLVLASSGHVSFIASAQSVTATKFTASVRRVDGSTATYPVPVTWLAIGV